MLIFEVDSASSQSIWPGGTRAEGPKLPHTPHSTPPKLACLAVSSLALVGEFCRGKGSVRRYGLGLGFLTLLQGCAWGLPSTPHDRAVQGETKRVRTQVQPGHVICSLCDHHRLDQAAGLGLQVTGLSQGPPQRVCVPHVLKWPHSNTPELLQQSTIMALVLHMADRGVTSGLHLVP